MEYCPRQCLRRTFFAVMIGISPIVLCLLFIALARLLLHCFELVYNYRQSPDERRRRRRSSSIFHQAGRPTLSYTPVSLSELQRIIQGEHQNHHQNDSSFFTNILNRKESQPSVPKTNALANLVIRRNAIDSTPLTALFAPVSTSSFEVINERINRRPSIMTIKHESIETTTLATITPKQSNGVHFNLNDLEETDFHDTDPLMTLPQTMKTTTTTTTVVVEEYLDFHSVHSIPYSLSFSEPLLENND